MKAYTDIEQSKYLAKILLLESADMHYNDWAFDFYDGYEHTGKYIADLGTPQTICGELDIPCWSLAALLGALPSATLDSSDNHRYRVYCNERFTDWHDNPIDACVSMLLKLHEQKIL